MQLIFFKSWGKAPKLIKVYQKKKREENPNNQCSLPYHLIRSIHNIRRKKTMTIKSTLLVLSHQVHSRQEKEVEEP